MIDKKIYVPLLLSFFLVMGLDFFVGQFRSSSSTAPEVDTYESIAASPDIKLYTETAVSIVIGTVQKVESSYTQIQVEETLKGVKLDTVSVLTPFVDSEEERTLFSKEYGLFFLCQNTAKDLVLCGDSVGVCVIDNDKQTLHFGSSTVDVSDFKSKISSILSGNGGE